MKSSDVVDKQDESRRLIIILVNNYFDLKIWLGLVLFRIDVGLFFGEGGCGGLLCNNFFFLFLDILVQNLFGIKILKVYLILLEGVPIFLKGKQIKKFKLLYINFFFFFQVKVFLGTP